MPVLKAYVLVDRAVHRMGRQRFADAFAGRRQEPQLCNKIVHYFEVGVVDGKRILDKVTACAFDVEGFGRNDLALLRVRAVMDNLDFSAELQKRQDALAQKLSLNLVCSVSEQELVDMARMAKTLPTDAATLSI